MEGHFRGIQKLMASDSDEHTLEMVCQLLGVRNDLTDLQGSKTKTTRSSLKPAIEHITGVLNEKNDDAQTKK